MGSGSAKGSDKAGVGEGPAVLTRTEQGRRVGPCSWREEGGGVLQLICDQGVERMVYVVGKQVAYGV
jgi:hypothetical protein